MAAEDYRPRGAEKNDYPGIRDLILSVWANPDDELGIWDYLVANDPVFRPEHTRIVVAGGRPVATTSLLPRRILGRTGWVDGAELTLVACHPDYRNRGFAGGTVRDSLCYMAESGMALAVFYGEPGFYPRFGCAPVLPTLRTEIGVGAGSEGEPGKEEGRKAAGERLEDGAGTSGAGAETLEVATEADTAALLSLYERHTAVYPCSVARVAEPWMWRARNPETGAVLVLGDRSAYAYVGFYPDRERLLVREAGAGDVSSARRLLASLTVEARKRGLGKVHLGLPPGHLLVRLAMLGKAEQHYWPAESGFAVVTRWDPLLPEGYRVAPMADPQADHQMAHHEPRKCVLFHEGRPVLGAGRHLLTQLVLGYRGIDDVLLALESGMTAFPGCRPIPEASVILPAGADLDRLRFDFPREYPKYSEAPFIFWF